MNSYTSTFFRILLAIVLFLPALRAQIPANTYTSVQSIDYCTAGLQVDGVPTDFEIGSSVILIQMNGALIEDSNSSAFGTITDLRNTGLYEKGDIARINGDTIFLAASLVNEYNTDAALQVVSMPTLANATMDQNSNMQAWDGTTGGVLALNVTGTLTINGEIDLSQSGFRGGALTNYDTECTGGFNNANRYYYEAGDWRGAGKGEGVAPFISGRENGRGPQANGGGGGNDHNSGGGGGANIARGGNGGRRETPFLDISFSCKGDNPGLRGKALNPGGNRIFMGGGGGAGHANNGSSSRGGNGGGIVIIQAENIVSNDGVLNVSGESALDVVGDGAGAGGAGGTVILLAPNLQGALTVNVRGGNGGAVDAGDAEQCYGPGGGGAGGAFYTNLNSNQLNVELAGGQSGILTNSLNNCNNSSSGAENGEEGQRLALDLLPQGTEDSTPPMVTNQPMMVSACVQNNTTISVENSGVGVSYQWQIDRGNGFEDLLENVTYTGVNSTFLVINNVSANMGDDIFRLLLTTDCFGTVASDPIALDVQFPPEVSVEFTTEERTVFFTNSTSNASSFSWDFGDGNSSTATNPNHTYTEDGTYTVTLEIMSDCGTSTETFTVTVISSPVAAFSADQQTGCAPFTVQFTNESNASATDFEWAFPGGNPATSTEANPSVVYESGGSYPVSLTATNSVGSDVSEIEDFITVQPLPSPDFSFEVDNETFTVIFNNTSNEANTYSWDFGDGNSSMDENPTHTFAIDGLYAVTLTATNDCGSTTFVQNVEVGEAPTPLFTVNRTTGCAPLTVQFTDRSQGLVQSRIWEFPGGTPATSTDESPTVRYESGGDFEVSLTVGNTIDDVTRTIEAYIQVSPKPLAMFDFEVDAGTVTFTNLSQGATRFNWDFGDGATSTEENPTHTYAANGFYDVTLNAFNDFCGTSFTQSVLLMVTSVETIGDAPKLTVFPNPTSEQLQVAIEGQSVQEAQVRLLSANGKLVQETFLNGKQTSLHLGDIPAGLYFLHIIAADWQHVQRVVKQ